MGPARPGSGARVAGRGGAGAHCHTVAARGAARASKLEWSSLEVDVEGVLDRVEGVSRLVRSTAKPRLSIASPERETLARTVLDKAKRSCLVTNSLNAECDLVPTVTFAEAAPAAQ